MKNILFKTITFRQIKRKLIFKLFILLTIFIFSLFIYTQQNILIFADSKTIVTTIYPYYLVTKYIVKNKIKVQLFIPPNASPHTYSPNPSEIYILDSADIIIANGLSLEENLKSKLQYYNDKVIYCSDIVSKTGLISFVNEKNPHIWLDPVLMIEIAKGITNKIIELDQVNKQFYINNLNLLISNLQSTINLIKTQRKNVSKKIYIITFHDSFKYFAKRFNITIAGVIEPSPGKEPGIKELIIIGKTIKKYDIKSIFSEPQLNPKPVMVLAKEYNLKIFNLDPLGFSFKIKNIEQLYIKNWQIILKSLN